MQIARSLRRNHEYTQTFLAAMVADGLLDAEYIETTQKTLVYAIAQQHQTIGSHLMSRNWGGSCW